MGLKLLGNGVSTPSKTMGVFNGVWRIVNDAGNTTILSLADHGLLTTAANVSAPGYVSNGSPGVSCSGSPTSSFASVNGVVTHC